MPSLAKRMPLTVFSLGKVGDHLFEPLRDVDSGKLVTLLGMQRHDVLHAVGVAVEGPTTLAWNAVGHPTIGLVLVPAHGASRRVIYACECINQFLLLRIYLGCNKSLSILIIFAYLRVLPFEYFTIAMCLAITSLSL